MSRLAPSTMHRPTGWIVLTGTLALAVLMLPFAGLLFATPWLHLHLQAGDGAAIGISVGYTLVALLIVVIFGTPLAWWLARHSFRGKLLVDALVLLPLLAPPLTMGLMLSMVFGPYGWAGEPLRRLGLELTNTPQAFVLAQVYGAVPYFVVTARAAFEGVPQELEHMALTLGRGPWSIFWRITLPLSSLGLASGLALAWVRAMGEFGIVLIVAYFPQGIPVKLWANLQDSGLDATYPLLWLFFVVALPLPLALGLLSRRQPVY
ncbi:MAG TPA: ABC transporter permease subunit [Rhodanobacter sp.]|nr:ABC transporter permease subunit [Rhodanobacter sp.]